MRADVQEFGDYNFEGNVMKAFYDKFDLKQLSLNSFRLAFLLENLSHDGPLSMEYVNEKINLLREGKDIQLHERLEEHMRETLKWKPLKD